MSASGAYTEVNLSPAAERRRLLRAMGFDEEYLISLREVDPEEAQWRIDHEFNVGVQFLEKRRQFLVVECIENRQHPKRRQRKTVEHIIQRQPNQHAGSKLG
jgi:hypothetical protein